MDVGALLAWHSAFFPAPTVRIIVEGSVTIQIQTGSGPGCVRRIGSRVLCRNIEKRSIESLSLQRGVPLPRCASFAF